MIRLLLALLAAGPSGVVLHAGQVRFYAPGQVRAGATVTCVGSGGRTRATVPATTASSAGWDWGGGGGGPKVSVEVRAGAVAVACGADVPSRLPDVPYVLGRNGLGLLRGTNTLAGVRKLFGGTAAPAHGECRLSSSALGFTATFGGSCAPSAPLLAATVTGARWSSLDGVRIGDSLARMRWQDAPARKLAAGVWLLGGVGAAHPPRLLAVVRNGRVAAFEIRTR